MAKKKKESTRTLKKAIVELIGEKHVLATEIRELRSDFTELKEISDKNKVELNCQIKEERDFMKAMVLHLTSKPIKIVDHKGTITEDHRRAIDSTYREGY